MFVINRVTVYTIIVFLINYCKTRNFESLRSIEGYPAGFLSDCPGSTKVATISNNSLKYLSFVLYDEGGFLTAKNFNYFQMKNLAKKMDLNKKTVLYMNGYLDSALRLPFASMMGFFYYKLGYNVLLLEYHWFTIMVYPKAARFLRPVCTHTAEMLASLTMYGLDPNKLEITGFSLGGHGAGYIGKHYRHLTARNVSRITGLDPSGPCFRHLGPKDRVHATDADFVDITHTNIDGYGMATPMGQIDYYINGGEFQPNDIPEIPCSSLCSHLRAFAYWLSALQHPYNFIAIKCETIQDARDRNCYSKRPTTNLLGLKADKNKTGIYYLATKNFQPYYVGANGVRRQYDPYLKYMDELNTKNVMNLK